MKSSESKNRIKDLYHKFTQQFIDLQCRLIDFVEQHNLRWPLIFCLLCFFSFWSEMTNYSYHKYFTKLLPALAVGGQMMYKLENLNKDFYDKFSYADYTAIGYIISVAGDLLFLIEDNYMGLIPGLCMCVVMNIWYFLSYFPCLYYHNKSRLTKSNQIQLEYIVLGIIMICVTSYGQAQIILSMVNYEPSYTIYAYTISQALVLVFQVLRKRVTLRRSYGYTCSGYVMDFVGMSLYPLVRSGMVTHWSFRLLWIAMHTFGQFFICRGMIIHCVWWEGELYKIIISHIRIKEKQLQQVKMQQESNQRRIGIIQQKQEDLLQNIKTQ